MWENKRKNLTIRNFSIVFILILIGGFLFLQMRKELKRIDAEDWELTQENTNQRQELLNARQENLNAIQLTYEGHLETLAQYLPGIVCWGDSLTAGTYGDVSYPYTLQKWVDAYLCDTYNLQYSVQNPENYTWLNWGSYKISVPVVNMGGLQEDSATVLARAGVAPFVVKSDFVIPADTETVTLELLFADGRAATLNSGTVGVNPVTIAGVTGTLATVSSSTGWRQYSYQFTRLEAGKEVEVAAGTEILTSVSDQYKDYIHIIWLGAYDGYQTVNDLVENVQKLLSRQQINQDRYLVIGPCTTGGSWSGGGASRLDALDTAMFQAFENHYVNVRKYLIEDGLRDAGMGATRADTASMTAGTVPPSFRSNATGADLNGVAYKLIGKLIYGRMERLGYFDEVVSELRIDETRQDILARDPQYYERKLMN